jgi:outer membrane protein insertion porin family
MKSLCVAVFLTISTIVTVSAQTTTDKQTSGSQVIERVIIRGNRRITESEIKSWISTHKRSVYDSERLDRDVRALYNTGHFDDVKVYVEDGLHGGKIITFEVRDRLLILDIAYEGIDSLQQAEAIEEWRKQEVELSKGSEFDPVKVRLAARIIQGLLISKGNKDARVNLYVEQQTATGVLLIFKVEVGNTK